MEDQSIRTLTYTVTERFVQDIEHRAKDLDEKTQSLLRIHLNKLWTEPTPQLDQRQYHQNMLTTIAMLQIVTKDYLFDAVEYFRQVWGYGGGIVSLAFQEAMDEKLKQMQEEQQALIRNAMYTVNAEILAAHSDYPVEIIQYIQKRKIEITDAVKTVNRQFKAKYILTKDAKLKNKILGNWKTALGLVGR